MGNIEPDWLEINIRGPYVHGIWENPNKAGLFRIGNEESLSGRSELILNSLLLDIKKYFSHEELSQMTLIDVGSYDGLLSYKIEQNIKLKKIFSLEPRKKILKKENLFASN